MAKKKNKSDDYLKYSIAIAVLIAGASLAYYFAIFLPQNAKETRSIEESKISTQKQLQLENDIKYENCLTSAATSYRTTWNSSCEKRDLEEDCSLPQNLAKEYNDSLEADQDRCARVYK